ncbi:MAG TPA: fructose-6-phosphate aldolase [Candidatus Saccharimonadales bacterium]|nr:fructose-6-phosphate aldolase [Candidatus Saccharimonadales bacterium]
MKIFLDTANVKEIQDAASLGILDGVTTNPSLLAKEPGDPYQTLVQICEVVKGPVSGEVVATDHDGIVAEARKLAKLHQHVVVKVPMIREGLRAIRTLSQEGVKINCTLIFNAVQGLMAAKAGATYLSPFVGRIDDSGHEGMELVRDLVQIVEIYHLKAEVLAASLRHPLHVREAALAGAHVATMPKGVFDQCMKHPLTDLGLARFLEDWKKVLAR